MRVRLLSAFFASTIRYSKGTLEGTSHPYSAMEKVVPPFVSLFIGLLFFDPVAAAADKYPVAKPTDRPGVVISPFAKDRKMDVAGLPPGSLAEDPIAKKIFRLPGVKPQPREAPVSLPKPKPKPKTDSVPKPEPKIKPPKPLPTPPAPKVQKNPVPVKLKASKPPLPKPPPVKPVVGNRSLAPETTSKIKPQSETDQIEQFMAAFTDSGQVNKAEANVDFMHSRVEYYYGTKYPSRNSLLRDRSNYIKRWPQRRYWVNGKPSITKLNDGVYQVVSKIGYEVKNGSKKSSGVATSIARVIKTEQGLRIVSIREK